MNINFNNIKYYFLTYKNDIRKNHIINEMNKYNLNEVNPIPCSDYISKYQSGATGFCKMLNMAILDQDKNKPFQPFVLLEDDVKKYRNLPNEIEIPNDTDILYIGLSKWGIIQKEPACSNAVFFTNIPEYPDIVKIYNMCSTHSLIICSINGLLTLQKCLMEDFYNNNGYDVTITKNQWHINTYALKKPLF